MATAPSQEQTHGEERMPLTQTVMEKPQETHHAAPASHRNMSKLFALPLPALPNHAEPPTHPYLASSTDRSLAVDIAGTSGPTDEDSGTRRRKKGPRPSSERTPRTPEERQARRERREARRAERETALTTLVRENQPQHPAETAPASALYTHGGPASAPPADRLAAAQQLYKGLQVRALPLWAPCAALWCRRRPTLLDSSRRTMMGKRVTGRRCCGGLSGHPRSEGAARQDGSGAEGVAREQQQHYSRSRTSPPSPHGNVYLSARRRVGHGVAGPHAVHEPVERVFSFLLNSVMYLTRVAIYNRIKPVLCDIESHKEDKEN